MKIQVPFGEGVETVDVPEDSIGEIVFPNELQMKDEETLLLDALSNPLGSRGLSEFLKGAKDVVVIVNDATRPTPTAMILNQINSQLKEYDFKVVIATGMHRAPTEDEYRFIFGERHEDLRPHVHPHDSKNGETVRLGTTKRGTEVRLNKMVMEADKIIVIGSVEPHYFAGYTGGRKAFLPGVSAYGTIEQNHKLALSIEAQALRLEGNPVHEDMKEAMTYLEEEKIFSIMVVLDRNHKICSAYAGNIDAAFDAAVPKADEVFVVEMKSKAEIVVAVTSFPHDIDLYQSQKALDNAKYAVKDGGIIILVSACRTGIGPDNFLNLLASAETPEAALEKIAQKYKLGYHKAAKMAEIGLKMKMFAVTRLEPSVARKAHLMPMATVQEAIDAGLAELGANAKVTFIMDAVITVPKVRPR
ncbi:MAG: nickel-dependent lactate racemase [Thermoplasmata archaeon]|nr:nickel-dependent lactate racemase [Thermoplasmata archaeon]